MQDDNAQSPCCAPSRPGSQSGIRDQGFPVGKGMPESLRVTFKGGRAFRGTASPLIADDGEAPIRETRLRPFEIGVTSVTNREFAAFIDATGYETDAERFGWSFVFRPQMSSVGSLAQSVPGAEWWQRVDGANWKNILGPGSAEANLYPEHPVVHVSWHDAKAFAEWVGGRLPTETEWEHAARSGSAHDIRFPWGDAEPNDIDTFPCNIWQGRFPDNNTAADGWAATAPVTSFRPNEAGLYNMVGNVWEWTSDIYTVKSLKKAVRRRLDMMKGFKVLKGGSFLCHRSYCYRYRIAARTGNSAESSTNHQGFRVAWDRPG